MNTRVHDPDETCDPDSHCWIHHVDEPVVKAKLFVLCFECGHLYPTPRSLRKAYRVAVTWMLVSAFRYGKGPKRSTLWLWIRSRFRRACKIYFCQFCLHDF